MTTTRMPVEERPSKRARTQAQEQQDMTRSSRKQREDELAEMERALEEDEDEVVTTPGVFRTLLSQISDDDPSLQLVGLTELANLLSISTEDSLTGYMNIDQFVGPLVEIMRGSESEMMLLACRSLANLMEAVPAASANVAYGGAIPVLCSKLLEIEYIDLAEQALSTLERISRDYPASVVREGGLGACLAYLDFFPTNVQRTAVTTAANCARDISVDAFGSVRDVMPTLQNIIMGGDAKVVEGGCLCLSRVVASFRGLPDKLGQLCNPTLLGNMVQLLSQSSSSRPVNDATRTRLLQALTHAAASTKAATQLLQLDLVKTLHQLLTEQPAVLAAALQLVSAILPADEQRAETFRTDCPEAFDSFAVVMLPTLLDVFNSTVNGRIRQTTLRGVMQLLTHMAVDAVGDVPLASFVAGVLSSKDGSVVAVGVRLAQLLLRNDEEVYARKLETEGCIALIEGLAGTPLAYVPPQYDDDEDDEEDDEDEDEMEQIEIGAEDSQYLAKAFLESYHAKNPPEDKSTLRHFESLSKRLHEHDTLEEVARWIAGDA